MSLRDLKKSTPSNSSGTGNIADLETFIEGAQCYAYGLEVKGPPLEKGGKCKNATFSLTSQSSQELSQMSKRTGISKSRLLRILIHDQYFSDDQWLLLQDIK